jgi:outer membrane protein TolC
MKYFVFLALTAAAVAAAAADIPLTLAEAQRRAVSRSMQLVAQDAAISASRHMASAAGHLPDPTLKAGIENVPVTGPERFNLNSDSMTMLRVGLMQELPRSDKLRLRSERYELEAEKSEVERTATLAAIQRDTALAWLDRYYADAAVRLMGEQVAQASLGIEAAESAYRSGRGTQADVLSARGNLASLQDRASEARRKLASAKVALARWIGDEAQRPLAEKPSLDTTRMHGHHLPTEIASHPMVAMLARQEQIAATDARLASANRSPDWSVELAYQGRGSPFSDMVSIGVSIPLQWDRPHRQDEEVASKLATADQARALREDALQAHLAEVQAMLVEWDDDRERLHRYETEIIPLAKERSDAALAAYRGSKASLIDVLSARRGEIDARQLALQLEADAARVWAQLNFLVPDESVLPAGVVGARGEKQ